MTKRQKEKQAMISACNYAGLEVCPEILSRIAGYAKTLRRLYECEGNGCTRDRLHYETYEHYDHARGEQMRWVENRQKHVVKQIQRLADVAGVSIYLQTDPRGPSIYLAPKNSNINQSNYSTFGVGIY